MMKTWFRGRRVIVLTNLVTKLCNGFQVRVVPVLLDDEVADTFAVSYKKGNFYKYCANGLCSENRIVTHSDSLGLTSNTSVQFRFSHSY